MPNRAEIREGLYFIAGFLTALHVKFVPKLLAGKLPLLTAKWAAHYIVCMAHMCTPLPYL